MLPFSDHDELYWDVIGHEWGVPIERAEHPGAGAGRHHRSGVLRRTRPQLAAVLRSDRVRTERDLRRE